MDIKIWLHDVAMNIEIKNPEWTLAQTLWLSGKLKPRALCSGLGNCGACRVRFLSKTPVPSAKEREVLGIEAVQAGWRLACGQKVEAGLELALPEVERAGAKRADKAVANKQAMTLAVDWGTTSVAWQVERGEEIVAQGQELNPQMGAGADIISRLRFSLQPEGLSLLQALNVEFLKGLVEKYPGIEQICFAANSALTSIFLGIGVQGLAFAPYGLNYTGGLVKVLDLPPVYLPPPFAPFVGGDLRAGLSYILSELKPEFPFIFLDLGTNGECILGLDNNFYCTSVPLGPALEGIGLRHGGVAEVGSIIDCSLQSTGLKPVVLGGGEAKNICAAGYLSLIELLLRSRVLTAQGQLVSNKLWSKLLTIKMTKTGWCLPVTEEISLWAKDVEEILKVKAALSVAVQSLLNQAGLTISSLKQIYLGGALGQHVKLAALERLFFPGQTKKLQVLGNTSLKGASLLLRSPQLQQSLQSLSCINLNLTEQPDFMEQYLTHMHF